jgi:hypothetical protein
MSPSEIATIQSELANLATSKKTAVRVKVAESLYAPTNILELLSKDKSGEVKRAAAANPNTPHAILKALYKSTSIYVKEGLSSNPALEVSQLLILSKTSTSKILTNLANNKASTLEVLESAFKTAKNYSYGDDMYQRLAMHSNASEALRTEIMLSGSYMEQNIANDDTAPAELLEFVSRKISAADYYPRRYLASNPNAPAQALIALINTDSYSDRAEICQIILEREDLPAEVLQLLVKDDDPEIRLEALNHLAKIDAPKIEPIKSAKPYIAPPMDVVLTSEDVFRELLSNDESMSAKIEEAKNAVSCSKAERDTDPEVLAELALHPNIKVRQSLCQNELIRDAATPAIEAIALVLAGDANREVRNRLRSYGRNSKVMMELANDSDLEIRRYVASDPYTPQDIIQVLARDPDPQVRFNAANRIGKSVPIKTPVQIKEEPKTSYAVPMMLGSGMIAGMLLNGLGSLAKNQVRVAMPEVIEEAVETALEATA